MLTGYPLIFMRKEGEPVWQLMNEAKQFFGDREFDIIAIAEKSARERRKVARELRNKQYKIIAIKNE